MKPRLLGACALLVLLVAVPAIAFAGRGIHRGDSKDSDVQRFAGATSEPIRMTVVSNGRTRDYWLYKPSTVAAGKKVPLELVLDLQSSPPSEAPAYERVADHEGFLVAFLRTEATVENPDQAFVGDVIDDLVTKANVDPNRVHATGASGGAFEAYRIACGPVGSKLAGVGGLFGGIITAARAPEGVAGACNPTHPISVVEVHGTNDPYVPYSGRPCQISESGRTVCLPSQRELMQFWATTNGCTAAPSTSSAGKLRTDVWQPCQAGTAVELVTVAGGGHTSKSLTVGGLTPAARIWSFLSTHPRQAQAPLRARLLTVRVVRAGASRRVKAQVSISARVAARMRLVKGRSTIASGSSRASPPTAVLQLNVPKKARSGRYTVKLRLDDGAGQVVDLARSVHVPR